jgi:chromate transporter
MTPVAPHAPGNAVEVFFTFLRLGLTSFGGPLAHIGYFRREFVQRRRWLDDPSFAELLALSQILPGPASSKLGFSIGLIRAGYLGALAAFIGFTLPSAGLMMAFALALPMMGASDWGTAIIHGLKLAAVAIVAQAVIGLARNLCPDWPRRGIALAMAALCLLLPAQAGQVTAITGGALLGIWLGRGSPDQGIIVSSQVSLFVGNYAAFLFAAFLAASFFLTAPPSLSMAAGLFRSGALVFGGGHVVLPLLRDALVVPGWIDDVSFLAAYGIAQIMPGPLFSIAAFLGTAPGNPMALALGGGMLSGPSAILLIFLPGLLLQVAALPYQRLFRRLSIARAAIAGINAAVVGILASALYDPIGRSSIGDFGDLVFAGIGLALLLAGRRSPIWVVVILTMLTSIRASL